MRGRVERERSVLWTAGRSAAGDRHTMDTLGMPSPVLMERAALCVAHEIEALLEQAARSGLRPRGVYVLCGPGNNGGDGLAIARILHARGLGEGPHRGELEVRARIVTARHNDAVAQQRALAEAQGIVARVGPPEDESVIQGSTSRDVWVVVDALLGTGARGAPRGAVADAIEWINVHTAIGGAVCVAVDVPSGVDADTGRVPASAVQATRTVTFQRSKPGLHITPGRDCAGEVVIADIGLVEGGGGDVEAGEVRLIDPADVVRRLGALGPARHKGERGHVAIVGGSAGTFGAAVLAGAAALRAGAGLATIVSRDPTIAAMLTARPELMVARPEGPTVHAGAGVLIVGPGLTAAAEREGLPRLFREDPRPAVWDASALDEVLLDGADAPAGPRVLTPHPGEAARMLSRLTERRWTAGEVQAERVVAARALAQVTRSVVVLKGAGTLVCDGRREERPLAIAVSGSEALATAGSGDCLAGIVGAFLGRRLSPWQAACAAVHVHGVAGEWAARVRPGSLAMDIADASASVLRAMLEPEESSVVGPLDDHPRCPRVRRG